MEIEYIDETHTYLVDGVITPSVTQLLERKFKSKYNSIPERILNEKAEFGNRVHEFIELDCKGETPPLSNYTIHERLCCEQWLKLRQNNDIQPVANEMLVHYKDKYCGRLDMIADVRYFRCLCDVKTTAQLDERYLKYQLGLYYYALKDMGYEYEFKDFLCIWLPKKDVGKLVEIPKLTQKEFDEFMEEYGEEQDDTWDITFLLKEGLD